MNRLSAKVKAVNKAHTVAKELYPLLRAALEPWVGHKVVKKDGGLIHKVAVELPEFPNNPGLHVYQFTSDYSLAWVVKTWEDDGSGCTYHEVVLYLGDLRGGILEKMYGPPDLRTDYTEEEVLEKRAAYEVARKVMEDARSALHPFGEYDR